MRIPTFTLEGTRLPRVIFSFQPSLMQTAYNMGVNFFDVSSGDRLRALRALRVLTEDERLKGLCHVEADEGILFFGKPLRQFEGKLISTIKKNLFPPQLIDQLKKTGVWTPHLFFPPVSSSEVFTQKEVDRLTLDLFRFDQRLALFSPEESPFISLGGKYADWLSALGRIDLLKEMAARIRQKGFIPILSAYWATFILPKAKSIDVAAYAIPVNKRWSLFDLAETCMLIKKFDKPLISLNPLADGALLNDSEDALSFLFRDLKIQGAIAELNSEQQGRTVLKALEKYPSLTPPRKKGSPPQSPES